MLCTLVISLREIVQYYLKASQLRTSISFDEGKVFGVTVWRSLGAWVRTNELPSCVLCDVLAIFERSLFVNE